MSPFNFNLGWEQLKWSSNKIELTRLTRSSSEEEWLSYEDGTWNITQKITNYHNEKLEGKQDVKLSST